MFRYFSVAAYFVPLFILSYGFGSIPGVSLSSAYGKTDTKSFSFRIPSEPETLDWNLAHTPIETHILVNLMDGLVSLDSNLKVVPALAQSWKMSPDGKTYTFQLRPGVKWSDGVGLKAQDFVYSWKRLLTPATAASYAYFLFDIQGAEAFHRGEIKDFNQVGIHALDDSTIQIKLKNPIAHWIYIPTFWVTFPLRQDIVEKYGAAWARPSKMVTVGPFMLAAHEPDAKIVLKKNPNYYGTLPNLDQVTGYVINDDATALKLYESGRLDFLTDLSAIELARLSDRPDLKAFPYLKTVYLGFVIEKFPASNVKFRRAVAKAIDKSKIGELLRGKQIPATAFVPPPLLGNEKNIGLQFQPALAKTEIQSLRSELKQPIEMEVILPNTEKALTLMQYIQGELKKNLEVEVKLQPFDNKTYQAKVKTKTFPAYLLSWSADYPDPDNYLSVFLGTSGNNRTGWKNESFDQTVYKARGLRNPNERKKLYQQLQNLLINDEAIIIPLYYEPNLALVRPRVHQLELNPLNYLNLRKVTLDP